MPGRGRPFTKGDPRINRVSGSAPGKANARSLRGLFAGDREFIREQAKQLAAEAADEKVRLAALELMAAYSDGKPIETKDAPTDDLDAASGAPAATPADLEGDGVH